MAVDQENVTKVISVLSHPLRREILLTLSDKEECSFTELLNVVKVDTGKLSFHLRSLSAFMEQTRTGKYKLNRTGENAGAGMQSVLHYSAAPAGAATRREQLP